MERGVSFFGLVIAGLLTLGCAGQADDDDDDDDNSGGVSSRCESLCELLWDCDTSLDVNLCINQCESTFANTSATCETAFEEFTDCTDAANGDCDATLDRCASVTDDFLSVCDSELEDISIGGANDPCVDPVYNSCFAFDGYCDEGTGSCAAGTDYSDCYC